MSTQETADEIRARDGHSQSDSDSDSDSVDRIIAQWHATTPELDTSDMAIIARLSRASRLLEAAMLEVFRRHDLHSGEFDILATLRRADPTGQGLTARTLATNTMVTSGAITNRLDHLVAKGLVTRVTDPQSRRAIRVSLTAQGDAVLTNALGDHLRNERGLLAALGASQKHELTHLLRTLLHSLENPTA